MTPTTPDNTETHNACNRRIKDEGGQAQCCDCVPHLNCEFNPEAAGRRTTKTSGLDFGTHRRHGATHASPAAATLEDMKLRDEINRLRRDRGSHLIDEPQYVDAIMALIAAQSSQAYERGQAEALKGKTFSKVTITEEVNIPAELRAKIAAQAAVEAIKSMHESIMRHELVLGTEPDQAYNYARIHRWIDTQAADLEQQRKEMGQ